MGVFYLFRGKEVVAWLSGTNEWTNERTHERANNRTNEQANERTHARTSNRTNEHTNEEWKNKCTKEKKKKRTSEPMNKRKNEWTSQPMSKCTNERLNGRMKKWTTERMHELTNEKQTNKRMRARKNQRTIEETNEWWKESWLLLHYWINLVGRCCKQIKNKTYFLSHSRQKNARKGRDITGWTTFLAHWSFKFYGIALIENNDRQELMVVLPILLM